MQTHEGKGIIVLDEAYGQDSDDDSVRKWIDERRLAMANSSAGVVIVTSVMEEGVCCREE